MDHLPYPKSATISPIEVPFICGHILYSGLSIPDNQSFSSFLKGLPPCEEFYKSNLYHAAEIAQAHVYFGLLRLAVEPPLKVNEWIQRSEASGCQVVTLKLLNTRNWKSRSSRRGWFQWWKTCLVLVLPTVLEHASFIRTHGELGDIIGVSIETLAWTLAEGDRFYTWPRFKEGDILHCRMLDAGWCPYWTEIYCNRLSPPTIYLLSGFPQSQYGNHESCTPDTACRVHDVNPNNYETKHASGCQRQACRFRGPDVLELESIMEEDGIPLIRLSKKKRPRRERQHSPQSLLISTADDDDGPDVAEDTSIELDIVRHTLGRPFIAISHVWAGGLGHFEANTLPECQLRLLFDRARQCKQKRYGLKAFAAVWDVFREEDGDDDDQNVDNFVHNLLSRFVLGTTGEDDSTCYLWIDTLCIPTGDAFADSKTLKQKAINKMAQVYALAMHVLVIDQTVQTLSSKDDSEFAIAGTLLTCPWMTRCWTYQEGCLPRELSFLLNDGVINPREWPPGDQKDEAKDEELCPPGIDVERMLVRECLIDFRNMPDVLNDGARGKQHTQPMSQFIQIWNDLAVRRTTYPEDMHGILAVLLGLSVQEIFQRESGIPRSPSQRMLMVMKAQPSLPLSMLFISYPEDTPLCEDCQWVPKFPAGSLNDDFGSMSWTADSSGLLISLSDTFSHAFILDSQFQSRARDRFRIVTDAKNLPAKSRPSSRIPSKSQKISIPIQLLPSNAQSDDYFWNIRLCFILHGFNGVQTYRGACFSVLESSGSSPLKLNYLCPVSYQVQSQVVEADFTDPSHYTQDYRATVTGSKGDCLLSCDPSTWPNPVWRRKKSTALQKSLTLPVGVFITLFWAVSMIKLLRDPRWSRFNPDAFYEWSINRAAARIPLFHTFIDPLMRNYKYVLPLIGFFGRAIFFLFLDFPRLEAVAERVRYERFATSFDYRPVSRLWEREPNRLKTEPSYQFPRLWLIGIPAFFTVGQRTLDWMMGGWFSKGNEDTAGILMTVGMLVVWEAIGRIVVETFWRYFRLDLDESGRR